MRSPLTATFIQSTILNAVSNVFAQVIDQYRHNKPFSLNMLALLQFITYGILIVPVNFAWQKHIEARWPGFPRVSRVGGAVRSLFARGRRHRRRRRRHGQHSQSVTTIDASREKSTELIELNTVNDIMAKSATTTTTIITVTALDVDNDTTPPPQPPTLNITKVKHPLGEVEHEHGHGHGYEQHQYGTLRNFLVKFLLDLSLAGIVNIILFLVLIGFLKGGSISSIMADIQNDFWPIMTARLKFRPFVSGLLYTVIPVERRVVFGSACGVVWGVYLSLYAAV